MNRTYDDGLMEHLGSFISHSRRQLMDKVLEKRTRHITIVMEDIYQPHNASAVIRTCDCFGIQDIHIIENYNPYTVNPNVTLGASKWVDLYRYNTPDGSNTVTCLEALRQQGYRIYATTPDAQGLTLQHIPLERKAALVFGTELKGLSDVAFELADAKVHIPMFGFTESLNISVSAALCLHSVIGRLHASEVAWELSDVEKKKILLAWYRKAVRNSSTLEKRYQTAQENG